MAKSDKGNTLDTSHPLVANVVGAWLFDEGVGDTVNDRANGNHASRVSSGSPSASNVFWVNEEETHQPGWQTVDGAERHGLLTITGSQYQITGALSVVVGIKPASSGWALLDQLVNCSNADSAVSGYLIQNLNSDGTFKPSFKIGNGAGLATWGSALSNAYHQIVATYVPSSSASIVVDAGTPVTDTSAIPASLSYTGVDQFGILRQDHATARFGESIVYYVYVLNKALNGAEIASLHADPYQIFNNAPPNEGAPGESTGVVGILSRRDSKFLWPRGQVR